MATEKLCIKAEAKKHGLTVQTLRARKKIALMDAQAFGTNSNYYERLTEPSTAAIKTTGDK